MSLRRPPTLDRTEPLGGQLWPRPNKPPEDPDVPWSLRILAGLAAVLEAVLLGWLWFSPAMPVRSVEVEGARHLSAEQVMQSAGLQGAASIISVDPEAAQARLIDQV